MPVKILFFIESLRSGGKERRLVELLYYLKQNTNYQIKLVLTEKEIHYSYVKQLKIPIDIIERKHLKKDPSLFFRFYCIAKKFQPDIIHTWGVMSTFYAIPTKVLLRRSLLANLIADAKRNYGIWSLSNFFFKIDCFFADIVLGNSEAGLNAYGIKKPKRRLIYNGVRLERFNVKINKQEIRKKLGITTTYLVIMVASASKNKDYDLFLDVAKIICNQRNDVTFVAVGGGSELTRLRNKVKKEKIKNVILIGKRNDIENLVATSNIGVLFTNVKKHAEGISNSIIEYMALGKPVITTDIIGGSREIIEDCKSGFIMDKNLSLIVKKIVELLDNNTLREKMGKKGSEIIKKKFSIERMGAKFIALYKECTENYSI